MTQRFHRERPRHRALPPQRLAVEFGHRGTRGGERALDPGHHIGNQAFVDNQLPVGEQLYQHPP